MSSEEPVDSTQSPKVCGYEITTVERKYQNRPYTMLENDIQNEIEEELDDTLFNLNSNAGKMRVFRLFGFSCDEERKKKLLTLKYDTCFEGKYYETFYVFLKESSEVGNRLSVVAFVLPHFLPLKEWESLYLNTDIATFSHYISLHVNAYISRRQQFLRVKERFGENVAIVSSESYSQIDVIFSNVTYTLQYHIHERLPFEVQRVQTIFNYNAFPSVIHVRPSSFNDQIMDRFKVEYLEDVISSILK